jgi:hypothetical protein
MRSYRYTAPLFIYILAVVFVYTIAPNPVMESYAFSSALLFAISAWICFTFIDAEHETQQMITVIHAGSVWQFYMGKIVYIWLFTAIPAIFAVGYPALFHKFVRTASTDEWVVALICHMVLSLLGVSVSVFFTAKLFPKLSTSLLGLFLIVSLSLAGEGISGSLPPYAAPLGWLVPPVRLVIRYLNDYNNATFTQAAAACLIPVLYASLLIVVWIQTMKRVGFR